jgi:hypothetical protein
MAETLVVVSKVKKIIKDAGYRTGGDFIEGLSERINAIVSQSVEKAKADGKKKTVGREDLP